MRIRIFVKNEDIEILRRHIDILIRNINNTINRVNRVVCEDREFFEYMSRNVVLFDLDFEKNQLIQFKKTINETKLLTPFVYKRLKTKKENITISVTQSILKGENFINNNIRVWNEMEYIYRYLGFRNDSKNKFNKKDKPLIIKSDVDPYGEEDWSDE